jgi:hypothetical protein
MKDHKITRWEIATNNFNRNGSIDTMRKILVKGCFKPAQSYLNFLLKQDKYPQNIIFIAGLAKSGTTWLTNMFASLDGFDRFIPQQWHLSGPTKREESRNLYDLYPGFFEEFKNRLAVIHSHTWGRPSNVEILRASGLKYILTVRDPRDSLISQYWYVRQRPHHWDYRFASSNSLGEYITYQLESREYEQSIDWIRTWIKNRDADKSIILKYEDVLNDTYSAMRTTIDFMGLKCSDSEVQKIVEANTFEKYAGRERGREDTSSFFRKAIHGEWKEVFSERQRKFYANFGEDVIEFFGYEPTV